MNIPANLQYTDSHEWVVVEDDGTILVGLTDFAQDSMGEIVYVDLPEVDDEFEGEESFAEAESVKAVSEIYSPVDGVIVEVNEDLEDNPGAINEDPYGTWLVKFSGKVSVELLDAAKYREVCENED